jgi:tetratricopeptide (TPR) repeat protein
LRFYDRTQDDKDSCINRCYFEADHGNIYDTLRRIDDLDKEFQDDPKVYYAKGRLIEDFLGKGKKARELFKRSYELENTNSLALLNIMGLSRNENEFRKWANIVLNLSNDEIITEKVKKDVKYTLDEYINENYFEWLISKATLEYKNKDYGLCASTLEIALDNFDYSSDLDLVELRRQRAWCLREIDKSSDAKRAQYLLNIPPKERLSLHEALKELDNAIALDEFYPELWNFKSAWLILLRKYEEAIICAKKAIELRPKNYPRPYTNIAVAYSGLKMFSEAREYAEKSELEAKSSKSSEDFLIVKNFLKKLEKLEKGSQIDDLEVISNLIIAYVHKFGEKNIKQYNLSFNKLATFIQRKINKNSSSQDYINIMAEMLSTFPPETIFLATLKLFDKGKIEIHEKCLIATLYLVVNSEGIARRDAVKFIIISILANFKVDRIRVLYRRLILAPSEAADDKLSNLNDIINQEMKDMGDAGNEYLYPFIVKQAPSSPLEIDNAKKEILYRFDNLEEPPQYFNMLFSGSGFKPGPISSKVWSVLNRLHNRKRL